MRAHRPALFLLLFALAVIAPGVSAEGDPARAREPAGQPPVAEQQPRDILERVEVRPNGAVLFDGEAVTGDEAERLKLERDSALRLRFVESWDPDFLYYNHWTIFVPDLPRTVMELPTGGPLITGVATTPAAEVILVARTEESGSALQLVRPGGPDEPKPVHATAPTGDQWYHGPMTLSPNKRWLLAMASDGRRSAIAAYRAGSPDAVRQDMGDIVLLDCAAPEAPVILIAQTRLHSCTWSPDGDKALCHVELPGGDEPSFVLLDMGSHSTTVVAEGRGRAEWIGLGAALRVYLASGEVLTYEPSSGTRERQAGAAPPANGEWVWCDDGSVAACPVHRQRPKAIRIASPSGRVRTSPAPAGIERVLGWSAAGQLLAYVGRDSALHFCSGAVTDAAYEQFLSYVPPAAAATRDELRQSVALETRSSPLTFPPDQPLFWSWGRTPRGPFLAYVLADESGQALEVLQLERLSVWDLGMDPERPLPEQMAEQYLVSHIGAIARALRRYAADHDGRLPPAAAGQQLEAELAPYLDYPGQLHKLDSPGEAGIRLHRPGATLTDIAEAARRAAGQRVWILEYLGDYPTRGGLVAVCTERRTTPGQCTLSWHTVLERRGEGGEAAFEDVVTVWSETFGGAEIGGPREDQPAPAP